jgi:hypothetical protein
MPNFLVGSAYAVSSALIVWAMLANIIPQQQRYFVIIVWAGFGLLLALLGVLMSRRDQ